MSFRFLVPLLFIAAIDIYAFQAFSVWAQGWSRSARNILYAAYWAVPALLVLSFLVSLVYDFSHWNRTLFAVVRALFFIAYLAKFFTCSILLVDDVRRIFVYLFNKVSGTQEYSTSRSEFLSKFAIFLGALPFVTMSYGIIRNRHRYNVIRETITLKNLPKALDGLRIVQFSDVHSGSFTDTEPVKKAIELINAQNPDLVFFTGDLVNTKADEMDDYLTVFDKIKAKIGIFSVTGNHDYGDYGRWDSSEEKIANFERLKGHHKTLGWDLLMNENRILEINGEKLAIIGVENYSGKPQFSKYGKLDKAYEGTQNVPVKLLLSHDPTHWEAQILNYKDIDITFSGHTHGTQFGIEIPGLRWSPAQYIYKQWAGLYQEGQQYLYVNRGLGYLGYPGRVGILPEITVIELKA
jgi:predicted MPP superfamily phosphohydrolase